MNYGAIRRGLADRLETLDALVAVYAEIPDRVVAPSAAVVPGDPFVSYHESMEGGGGQLILCRFDVLLLAGRFDTTAGQDTLDQIVSDLPAALEGDESLGGESVVVLVREATNYGLVTIADSTYLGCRFNVEVYAR